MDRLFRDEKPQAWVKNWIYRNERVFWQKEIVSLCQCQKCLGYLYVYNIYVVFLRTVNK